MKIRKARGEDLPAIKEIWNECFPGEEAFAELFFREIYDEECELVCELDGEIAGILSAFPCKFGELSAKYIYGVGTRKKFRSRGVAAALIAKGEEACDFAVLIPQTESLFAFYEKLGYTELFRVSKEEISPRGSLDFRLAEEGDIPYLNEVYEKCLGSVLHPERDLRHWETTISEYRLSGGGIAVFDGGYFVFARDGEKTYVTELFAIGRECTIREKAAGALGSECVFTGYGDSAKIGAAKLFSEEARKAFENKARYLNLMHN